MPPALSGSRSANKIDQLHLFRAAHELAANCERSLLVGSASPSGLFQACRREVNASGIGVIHQTDLNGILSSHRKNLIVLWVATAPEHRLAYLLRVD